MASLDITKIIALIENYFVPCQPHIRKELEQVLKNPHVSHEAVVTLVKKDVSIAAAVLQITNTPAFKSRAITQKPVVFLDDAVARLGNVHLQRLIATLGARDDYRHMDHYRFDSFWDGALDAAVAAAALARQLGCASPDEAYMLGLFRDCGIPILLQAFPQYYKEVLLTANQRPLNDLPSIEDKYLGINHQTVGYAIAQHWSLPEVISRAILTHHDIEPPSNTDHSLTIKKNTLVALVQVAERISLRFRAIDYQNSNLQGQEWLSFDPRIAEHLNLDIDDLKNLMLDTLDHMEELLGL